MGKERKKSARERAAEEREREREREQVRDKRESDERKNPKNIREHEHGTHATMGKRKRVSKALEETERNMYKTFSGAANAVSLLYTQAQSQQKRAYYAGLQDAYEKVLKFVENNSVSKGIQSTGGAHRHHQEAVTEFIQRELD